MELHPPSPSHTVEHGDHPDPAPDEMGPRAAWHDTEFRHHCAYLDRFPHGAVTEGTLSPRSGPGPGSGFPSFGESGRSVADATSTAWTDTEKLAFFGALARRSRWRPDLMADDIGSKTQREVVVYLAALERERRIVKVFQRPRRVPVRQGWVAGLAPAAREVSAARVEWEEKCAERARAGAGNDEEFMVPGVLERDESLRAFEVVAAAHRKQAHELVKQLSRSDDDDDEDHRAMRPRRMSILRRAKVALDRALERAKADRAARIIERVLRACDANGLEVMDVLVRQSAETTVPPPPGPDPSPTSMPPQPQPNTPSSRPQQRTIPSTRERQERERYAYLARFPVRRLDERHKAEKQMLAKRIRRREVRARKREEAVADGAGGQSSTEATAGTAPVETTRPLQDSGAASVHAKPGNLPSNMPRTATPPTTHTTAPLPDDPHHTALPLDLTSYRTHRPDTLAKHATKIAQEQYEKARAAYLARIPRDQLSAEQKHEKRTLGQRVRARERYRAQAAANVGLKVEELGMHMVDAPTADVRLLVLSERKRRRSTGQSTSQDGPAAAAAAADEGQAKRHKRYAEEEEEYERMLAMPVESMSKEDREMMRKLGSRIRSREWRRAQSTRVMTMGHQRERTVETDTGAADGAADAGEMANFPTAAADSGQASTTNNNVHKPVAAVEPRQTQTSAPCKDQAVATEPPVETPETAEPIKRKRGRPRKTPAVAQSAETVEPIKRKRGRPPKTPAVAQAIEPTVTVVPSPVEPSAQRTRRANQYDDLGIGKTRFAQELKAHHHWVALDFVSFCNLCDRELEEEFRMLLRVNVKAVKSLLKESRYAPQLYAFAQGCRLDLLDLPGMAKLLSRAATGEEGRTVDLTQLMASLGSLESLIRRTIELCSEITADPRLPDSAPAMVDQDSMLLSLSLLGQSSSQKSSREEKAAASGTDSPLPTRIPDAEWVDLVNPDDGLFEQDPVAQVDAEAEIEELRLVEVEEQQEALDCLEDEEYESRVDTATRHPEAVVMLDSALPVLENDIFDWTMYERDKSGRWRDAQKQVLEQSLPETWTKGISDEMPASIVAARQERVKRINELRQALRSTIYHQDRMRWQRIKRLRDPMYRYGRVPHPSNTYKSAAYIDTSDEGDSETETEEEDGIERNYAAVDHDPFEKEDEFEQETGLGDRAPTDKEDELEGEDEFEDYDSFEKEDELMEEHD